MQITSSSHLNYNWLKDQYENQQLTAKEIGQLVGKSERTICHHLNKAGIQDKVNNDKFNMRL